MIKNGKIYKSYKKRAELAEAINAELLKALEDCLPYLPTFGDRYNTEHPVTAQAKAAIAKAKGV